MHVHNIRVITTSFHQCAQHRSGQKIGESSKSFVTNQASDAPYPSHTVSLKKKLILTSGQTISAQQGSQIQDSNTSYHPRTVTEV